jgi:hypothetical protein
MRDMREIREMGRGMGREMGRMGSSKTRRFASAAAVVLLLLPCTSLASGPHTEPYRERPVPKLTQPVVPWQYQTDYYFGLTRGLREEVDSPIGRGCAMVGTIVLDVFILPAAALAGLFG